MYFYDAVTESFLHDEINDIPDSAFALTDEQYQQVFDAVSNGYQIIIDGTDIRLIDPAPSAYHTRKDNEWVLDEGAKHQKCADLRNQLIKSIDDRAAEISTNWIRFTIEYQEREAAALVFKEHGFQGEPSVYVTSFSSAAGIDNKTAAELILQQAEGLRTLQRHLATQRMRKYELKKEDLTEEELQSIHDDILHQMQTLAEAYE